MEENIFLRYWKYYGGWKALFSSRYFHSSIIITILLAPHWLNSNWWEIVLDIMPNVLGFSLGGYAMWIAMGDENFRKLISGANEKGDTSPFMSVNAAFVHFILLQIASILSALFASAYAFSLPQDSFILRFSGEWFYYACSIGAFIGYLIFIYALISAVAATLQLLQTSSWYDLFIHNQKKINNKKNQTNRTSE